MRPSPWHRLRDFVTKRPVGILLWGAIASLLAAYVLNHSEGIRQKIVIVSQRFWLFGPRVLLMTAVALVPVVVLLYALKPAMNVLRLRRRALPLYGRETETEFIFDRFLQDPSLRKSTPCLIVWGPNGIGKSHLLNYVEWRVARQSLCLWRRRRWRASRVTLHAGEVLAAALVRTLRGDVEFDALRGLEPAELGDQFLLRCSSGTLVLVDDLDEDQAGALDWLAQEIYRRGLRVKLIGTAGKRLRVASPHLFSFMWEDRGLATLDDASLTWLAEGWLDRTESSLVKFVVSQSHGLPGRTRRLCSLARNGSSEDLSRMEAEPEPLPERVGSDPGCLNILLKIAHLQLFGGVADVTILGLIGQETQRHVAQLASYDLLRGERSGALAVYAIPRSALSAVAARLTDARKQDLNREFAQIFVPYLQRVPDNWPVVQNLIALAKATLATLGHLPWLELAPVLQRLDLGPHLREVGPALFPRLAFDAADAPVEAKAMYGRCLAAHERYDDAISVLESLSTGSDAAVSVELPVRLALAECFRKTGRFRDGVAILEPWEESEPAPGSEQPRLERQAWSTLGKCHIGLGEHRRALRAFDKAISIGIPVHDRTLSDLLGIVDAWRGRNIVLRDAGRYRVALAEAIRLTSLIKTSEIRSAQAYVARTLTTCNLMLLRFEEALEHNRFAHDVAKALRHRSLLANCIWGDAEIARYRGDLQLATQLYAQALEIYEAIPDVQGVIYVHLGMADAHLKQGDHYLAASHYVKADELAAKHTCHLERLHVRLGRAILSIAEGESVGDELPPIGSEYLQRGIPWGKIMVDLILVHLGRSIDSSELDQHREDFMREAELLSQLESHSGSSTPPFKLIPMRH